MTKREKLWKKAQESPQNLTFDEFERGRCVVLRRISNHVVETLLRQTGWTFSRQRGSHRLWYSPDGKSLPIQPRKDGKAKIYQVQQFINYQQEEE
ncbi:MAG: type II toxin-antitoxin system HicA family toxin [Prochloraceae cyanobacterium]